MKLVLMHIVTIDIVIKETKQFLVNPPKPELGIMFNVNVRHMNVRHIFSSNQIVQKILFSLWFWASDLLFDQF